MRIVRDTPTELVFEGVGFASDSKRATRGRAKSMPPFVATTLVAICAYLVAAGPIAHLTGIPIELHIPIILMIGVPALVLFVVASRTKLTIDRRTRTLQRHARLWPAPWRLVAEHSFRSARAVRFDVHAEALSQKYPDRKTDIAYVRLMLEDRESFLVVSGQDLSHAATVANALADAIGTRLAGNAADEFDV